MSLHDVPSKDAEYEAVAGPGTDPPHGADGAPRNGMWQRAPDIGAHSAWSFAVYAAVPLVVLRVVSFSHLLLTIATSCRDVERRAVVCPVSDVHPQAANETRRPGTADVKVRCPTADNEPATRSLGGVLREPWR